VPAKVSVAKGQISEIVNQQTSNFVSVYSNNVAFTLNFFDLAMIFGEMVAFNPGGAATVEQKARVVMSLPHAKLFSMLLLHQIQQYESRFGIVPLPPLEGLAPELQEFLKQASAAGVSEG
jgi:hypothetical protein